MLHLILGGTIAAGTLAMVPREEEVTYAKSIAPLLQRKCQMCHQPNSIAPMSLLSYDDAKKYLTEIKEICEEDLDVATVSDCHQGGGSRSSV